MGRRALFPASDFEGNGGSPLPRINSSFTARIRNPGKDDLLAYLSRRFNYHTPEEWSGLLAKGRLELEGAVAAGGEALREGMGLRFAVVDYDEPEVPVDFRILERGSDFCFVHKPGGMPVHRTGRIFFQTLANLVKESLGGTDWAPLNRLDRETSGLVAFAKGAEAFRRYAPASVESYWVKVYAAVVSGNPAADAGAIEHPLGESADSAIRCRMHVLPHGKPALTLFRKITCRDGCSLLALAPVTGRKHQLRAHLAHLGHPIIGDKIYSLDGKPYLKQADGELDEADYRELGAPRHLLHSFHLRIGSQAGHGFEAWDWDVGADFAARFKAQEIRAWCATPDCAALMAEAEAAGRDLRSRPAG